MKKDRKVVLVGTGFVGMSMAYSFLTSGGVDELVLIDVDKEKAIGEAMDLQHGVAYARNKMVIKAGDYSECADAEIVVITAGTAQKPGQSRLDMTAVNTKIMRSIVEEVMKSGFDGIFVVASNPVDLMAYVVWAVSGLPKNRVIGTGTILDTARLRYLISEYLQVSTNNIHAYLMGEHGDSSFVPWTHTYIGCKNLLELLDEKGKDLQVLNDFYRQVQRAAYDIIDRKKATYYGIGLALNRLVLTILNDEHAIMTVSTYMNGDYGWDNIYIGVPAKIGHDGIEEIIHLPLNAVDQTKFDQSALTLKTILRDTIQPIL